MIINEDTAARRFELLTLTDGFVYGLTPAVYTIGAEPGAIVPRGVIVGPIETTAVRVTYHGVDPVVATKIGHLYAADSLFAVNGFDNIKNLRFVRETAATSYVPITYLY